MTSRRPEHETLVPRASGPRTPALFRAGGRKAKPVRSRLGKGSLTSRNQADRWMTLAEAACAKAVQEQFQPTLEAEAKAVLGKPERGAWFEYAADPTSGAPTLLFHYPSHQPTGFDYLRRAVKLEFGFLTDQQPVGRHGITPWLLDALPDAMPDWQSDVVALGIDRTFWEKATILHAEHHRSADKATPDRFSRHYADVAALARHPATELAIADLETLERVVDWSGMRHTIRANRQGCPSPPPAP